MKFLHLADLHIGRTVNEISMIPDQKYILDQIFSLACETKTDVILIAGDIYDKSIPSEEAVRLLDAFLSRCASADIRICMISGNHDSDERLNFGSSLFRNEGIYISAVYDGTVPHVEFEDEYGKVNVWMLPFVKASMVRHYHPDLKTDNYDEALRSALSLCDIHEDERNIIVAHQFVTSGSFDPESAGSENVSSMHVGTVEKVDASAFDPFDYAALGHIHRPQRVMRDTVRYAGSPLAYSLSEINQDKTVPLIELKEKGTVKIDLLPLHPLHSMRHLKGRIEDLLNPQNITDPQDYIYVTLTDETVIPEAISRIRSYYPNTMKLDYMNSHTQAVTSCAISQQPYQKSFDELVSEFSRFVLGSELSEEEQEVLRKAAQEAGVIG